MSNLEQQEIELAFILKDDIATLWHHKLLPPDPQIDNVITTYFDTPLQDLSKMGWSVRIRHHNDKWIQSVKGPTIAAHRFELNTALDDGNQFNIEALHQTPIRSKINSLDSLAPTFTTNVKRTIWQVNGIEICHDDGFIATFDQAKQIPINDVEFELKTGKISELFHTALRLTIDVRLQIQAQSKAQRGHQLITSLSPKAASHQPIFLSRSDTTLSSFKRISRNIIEHLRSNLAAACIGEPAGIHQIRVSIRRLRSAFVLFEGVLHPQIIQAIDIELRRLGQIFGDVRDLDVFLSSTLTKAKEDLPGKWIDLLIDVAIKARSQRYSIAKSELEGQRFNSLIMSIMAWIESDEGLALFGSIKLNESVRDVLPNLLTHIQETVERRGRKSHQSDIALHKFRKSMKKLRYSVEFCESLYRKKSVNSFLRPCKKLQEILGNMNDVNVTFVLLNDLISNNPAIAPVAGELASWLQAQKNGLEPSISKLIVNMTKTEPFWT